MTELSPIPAEAQALLEAMYEPLGDMADYDRNDSVLPGCNCGCGGDAIDWEEELNRYEEAKADLTALYHKLVEFVKSEGA